MLRSVTVSAIVACALADTATPQEVGTPTERRTVARSGVQPRLDRVLTLNRYIGDGDALPEDRGAAGLWHRLVRLRTVASVLHTTAHPDDEHADVLTLLSRRDGVRTALLSLNRGEGGANAIGAEQFDGLGVIRTEELLLAARHYGLDDLYFTTAVDYGFSKTLGEAYRSWDRDAVLGDMVRVIRLNRPLVVVSRWHGSERDGHGHHQASGDLTTEAVRAAGDPRRFSEQIDDEGLRPWTPLRLYRGGVTDGEIWHAEVDAGAQDPLSGRTYRELAARGLSLQRSQTSGRVGAVGGSPPRRYERLPTGSAQILEGQGEEAHASFFEGLDTSLSEIFVIAGETPTVEALLLTDRLEGWIADAMDDFDPLEPDDVVPELAEALATVRELLERSSELPEASFLLSIKERQIQEALVAALGLRLSAMAQNAASATAPGSRVAGSPDLGPVVPGQGLFIDIAVRAALTGAELSATAVLGPEDWDTASPSSGPSLPIELSPGETVRFRHAVQVGDRTESSRPWFFRETLSENRYQVRDSAALHLPWSPPKLEVAATFVTEGVELRVREVVRSSEADLPYGNVERRLAVAPEVSVDIEPRFLMVPLGTTSTAFDVTVRVAHNGPGPTEGTLRLDRERGWGIEPATHSFAFDGPGQEQTFRFRLSPGDLDEREYRVVAVATASGRSYREGHRVIRHRDLETRRLYRPASATVRGLDVLLPGTPSVGYVMGVGDEVPAAIRQLGADVSLLDDDDLARTDLRRFDVLVVGTRAYAVRPALHAHNARLLEYARGGGHLVLLYQTQEFVPEAAAPFPAQLPRGAQETSEEDAPVTLLAPEHPLLSTPNRLGAADFEGWIEQRGSKFLSEWDEAYTSLIETADTGQEPQRGVWLTADYGAGRYTYCALALHRQLPEGVKGAYRILANLLHNP